MALPSYAAKTQHAAGGSGHASHPGARGNAGHARAGRILLKKLEAPGRLDGPVPNTRTRQAVRLIHLPRKELRQNPGRKITMVELLPSILSADFAHLADQVAAAERGGGTVIHVDVMDGHFVPNITLGPPVVKSLRKATKLPLDCHLMIENPNEFIAAFADAGADWVSVHYEACPHLHRSLELIAHHGMKPGVVLNPATRVDLLMEILPMVHHVLIMSVNPGFGGQEFIPFSLGKIRPLAKMRKELGLAFRIEVDGGVAHDTIASVVQAGAELLVAGNAVFGAGEPERDARALLGGAGSREAQSQQTARHGLGRNRKIRFTRVECSQIRYGGRGSRPWALAMRWYEPVFNARLHALLALASMSGPGRNDRAPRAEPEKNTPTEK